MSIRILSTALALTVMTTSGVARHKERHLGPTGMYGVTSPKDIKIVKVVEGSPADGKIKPGDVIVKAGGIAFKDLTRQQFAAAVDQAETKEGKGLLKLTLKDGKEVDLQLEVLGAYSDTAPFDCPKTDALITKAADWMVANKKFGRGGMNVGLLGLLATGEEKYIKIVRDVIHNADWAKPDVDLSLEKYGRRAWSWGYLNILLAEYYMLTGDDYVRPALQKYSAAIAGGRDAAGLWGHGMATYDLNYGSAHGRLPGYAVMNASSLPCFLSLVLAKKAGIEDPEIEAGIEQTHGFYTDYIGRGTLPYGVHNPNSKSYNNNGMSGLAALAFSVHGNDEGAKFFSRMSAAAHNTMETGHTGHFFNQLWTGPGAQVAGPETSQAFFKKTRWYHTFSRGWEGNFTYDCSGYPNPIYSYRGMSDTGSHLLNLCLGRRKLCITGRDGDPALWLKGADVAAVIGLPDLDVKGASDEQLLTWFGHPMPKVRVEAIWTLRPREHKLGDQIRATIREGTPLARASAIGYYGYGCPKEIALPVRDDLMAVLRDPKEDINIRSKAAYSLCWFGEDGYPAFQDMLKLVLEEKPGDPRGILDMELGKSLNTLAPDPFAAGLVTDKELFYGAAQKLLDHRRADGRNAGVKLLAKMPIEDFHRVGDRVAHIVDDQDRTYHSYHSMGAKTEAISLLGALNIEGGMEAAMATLEDPVGKFGFKIRMIMAVLPKYGAHAQPLLPKLKEMNIKGRFENPWNAMIKSIEEAKPTGSMISMDEAMKVGKK